MNWTEMPTFEGIDLNDSFVFGWIQESGSLLFDLEASVWPASRYYYEPKNNEYTCYRRASLRFFGFESVTGLRAQEQSPFTRDPDGSIDYGNIDQLEKTADGFIISGDFGQVKIVGGEVQFEIHA
ncbi:MAG: hypothetical protein P1U64_08220 [Alcanivoracaceae bacterium]|jgi:hypothetical protein|nr:hypothetical protein [Alcanivoracaceae bacterium]